MKKIAITLSFIIICSFTWAQYPIYPAQHGKTWRGGLDFKTIFGKFDDQIYAISIGFDFGNFVIPQFEINTFDKKLDNLRDSKINFENDNDIALTYYHSIRLTNDILLFATSDNQDSSIVRLYCRIMKVGTEEEEGKWILVGTSNDWEHFKFLQMSMINYGSDKSLFEIILSDDASKIMIVSHTDGSYLNPHTNVGIVIFDYLTLKLSKRKIDFSSLPEEVRINNFKISNSGNIFALYDSNTAEDFGIIRIDGTNFIQKSIKVPGKVFNQFAFSMDKSENLLLSCIFTKKDDTHGFYYFNCNPNFDSIKAGSETFNTEYADQKNSFIKPNLNQGILNSEINTYLVQSFILEDGSFGFINNSVIKEYSISNKDSQDSSLRLKCLSEWVIVDKTGKITVNRQIQKESYENGLINFGSTILFPNFCTAYKNHFYIIHLADTKVLLDKYDGTGFCSTYIIEGCEGKECRINTYSCYQAGNVLYFERFKDSDFSLGKLILE